MRLRRAGPLLVVGVLVASCVATRMAPSVRSSPPVTLLPPCPASPNCVCSEDPDPGHRVDPISFVGSPEEAMARLERVIRDLPRTTVVSMGNGVLQVEFRTRILRFVDDVEFRLDSAAHVIQVRSASRVGYSDLGTNRRRVEQIRKAFAQAGA